MIQRFRSPHKKSNQAKQNLAHTKTSPPTCKSEVKAKKKAPSLSLAKTMIFSLSKVLFIALAVLLLSSSLFIVVVDAGGGRDSNDDDTRLCDGVSSLIASGENVDTDVLVAVDSTCRIEGATTIIDGHVILQEGSSIEIIDDATVIGKIVAKDLDGVGGGTITVGEGASIGGIEVKKSTLVGIGITDEVHINGDFKIKDSSSVGDVEIRGPSTYISGRIIIEDDSTIQGSFTMEEGVTIEEDVIIEESTIVGDLTFDETSIEGDVYVHKSSIGQTYLQQDTTVTGSSIHFEEYTGNLIFTEFGTLPAISVIQSTIVSNDLSFHASPTAAEPIDITGDITFQGNTFLDGSSLNFGYYLNVHGQILVEENTIDGEFYLDEATVNNGHDIVVTDNVVNGGYFEVWLAGTSGGGSIIVSHNTIDSIYNSPYAEGKSILEIWECNIADNDGDDSGNIEFVGNTIKTGDVLINDNQIETGDNNNNNNSGSGTLIVTDNTLSTHDMKIYNNVLPNVEIKDNTLMDGSMHVYSLTIDNDLNIEGNTYDHLELSEPM